jgi:predicted RNA-binding protein with PIN domain
MSWLIDGSNVLGRLRLPRESDAAKRELVTLLSRFARARRVKVACYFDGPEPASFAKHLGGVSVIFSGQRSADDLIVARVGSGTSWHVVTSDQALAARVAGRRVTIVSPATFAQELERLPSEGEGSVSADDWASWFSDPKNRDGF